MKYIIVCLLLLSGCMTAERRAELEQQRNENEIAECKKLGLKENSESFITCRLQIRTIMASEAASSRANYNAVMQRAQQNKPITCSTIGSMTSCR